MDSQTVLTSSLYAPNLHLFAFHLWRGLTGEPESLAPNSKQLWKRGDELLEALGFEERLHLYGYPDNSEEPPGPHVNLNPNKVLKLTGILPQSDTLITGRVLTERRFDSYSLTVNLRRPEQEQGQKTAAVPLSFWRNLNTEKQVFLPDFLESSLGQTLLLTAFLPEDHQDQSAENLQELARRCLQQVMPSRKLKRLPLCQFGELFGSPLFEFGGQILDANVAGDAEGQPHVLILLFRGELPSKKFVDSYQEFIDLFYYRNKVVSAYRETRTLYRKAYESYTDLEKKVKSFKQELTQNTSRLALTQAQLEDLKMVLKELAALDLEYARLLRNYKHCRNTISINTKNYQVTLAEILNSLQEQEYEVQAQELEFFREFTRVTAPYFQARIADEINYFVEGSSLADKAIASIRGIVEIEQTQRDRSLQEQNQQLQDQIQAIGMGIAVGAIVASTSTLIFQEPLTFPWQEHHGNDPHPFIIAFLLSFAFAAVAWGGVKLFIWCSARGRSGHKTP